MFQSGPRSLGTGSCGVDYSARVMRFLAAASAMQCGPCRYGLADLADAAERVAGSSVKSMIGHPQGASGASGVVTAALAISRGYLPPTINLRDQDPACDLDFIPNTGRTAEVEAALCNCLGFGSKNSAMVIGRA